MGPPPRLVLATFHRDIRDLEAPAPSGWQKIRRPLPLVDREIGGVQIQTEAMRAAMVRIGHDVVLVTPFVGSAILPSLAAAVELPLRLSPRAQQRWRLWWHGRLLRRQLRRVQPLLDGTHPTVIVAQCGFSAKEAHRFRSPSVPLVLVAH